MTTIDFPNPSDLARDMDRVVSECIANNLNRPIVAAHGEALGTSVVNISDSIILGSVSMNHISRGNFTGTRPISQYIGCILHFPEMIRKLVPDESLNSIIVEGSTSGTKVRREDDEEAVIVSHRFVDDGVIHRYIRRFVNDDKVTVSLSEGFIDVIWTIPEESDEFNAMDYVTSNLRNFSELYCKLLRYSLWQTCESHFPKFQNSSI